MGADMRPSQINFNNNRLYCFQCGESYPKEKAIHVIFCSLECLADNILEKKRNKDDKFRRLSNKFKYYERQYHTTLEEFGTKWTI